MKKAILVVSLFVASIFAPMSVNAQIKFGVKGGANMTSLKVNEDMFEASNRSGFFFGPTVKFTIPFVGLGLDASALYDQREGKVKYSDGTSNETLKMKQIVIPVNLRYGVGLGSLASAYIFAGPQFGFNIGDDEKHIFRDTDWKIKKENVSVNVGAGVTLIKHLQISANYNFACKKAGELITTNTDISTDAKSYNVKNNAWQVALAYYF